MKQFHRVQWVSVHCSRPCIREAILCPQQAAMLAFRAVLHLWYWCHSPHNQKAHAPATIEHWPLTVQTDFNAVFPVIVLLVTFDTPTPAGAPMAIYCATTVDRSPP
jgi:hypothetical protein